MSTLLAVQVKELIRRSYILVDEMQELRDENADLKNEVTHLRSEQRKYARRVVRSGRY